LDVPTPTSAFCDSSKLRTRVNHHNLISMCIILEDVYIKRVVRTLSQNDRKTVHPRTTVRQSSSVYEDDSEHDEVGQLRSKLKTAERELVRSR